jgi:2'-5' RNA ligase
VRRGDHYPPAGGRSLPDGPEQRRLFVAVPLSEAARSAVATVVERVREAERAAAPEDRPVRWVRVDGLHVTLRFLGATPESLVSGLERAVDAAAASVPPFDVRIAGAGGFPSPNRPRALWLGLSEDGDSLADLARRLDDGLAAEGWDRETRPFRAHLTLARADGVPAGGRTVARLIAEARDLVAGWTADRLTLYESQLGGGPARYIALHEARLAG